MHEMLRAAVQKMLKIRQNKVQRELSSSPKYTERSPTSPEQGSPVRGGVFLIFYNFVFVNSSASALIRKGFYFKYYP